MDAPEVLVTKGNALIRVREVGNQLAEARARLDKALISAARVGCSLRQMGDAAGMSFNGVGHRLKQKKGGDAE